jgi:hypothetical protein
MRGIIKFLASLVILAVLAWAGLWVYAQQRLAEVLRTYAAALTTPDGISQFTYDHLNVGLNPLHATATLTNARWSMQPADLDQPVVAKLASITARIDVTDPLTMHIDLPPRLDITTDGNDVVVTFATARIDANLDTHKLFSPGVNDVIGQNFDLTDINVLGSSGSIQLGHADEFAGHEQFALAATTSQTAVTSHFALDGLVLPPWLVQLGQLPFGGKLTHFAVDVTLSGPVDWRALSDQLRATQDESARQQLLINALHGWALAGGSGNAHLNVVLGPTTLDSSGAVAFDDAAQPSGRADLTANHLDALTSAIETAYPDTSDAINQAQSQLSPYLTTTATDGQLLTVHATYGKSGIIVNGTHVSDLPPLNWNDLLTPPADDSDDTDTTQPPGDGSGADSSDSAPDKSGSTDDSGNTP